MKTSAAWSASRERENSRWWRREPPRRRQSSCHLRQPPEPCQVREDDAPQMEGADRGPVPRHRHGRRPGARSARPWPLRRGPGRGLQLSPAPRGGGLPWPCSPARPVPLLAAAVVVEPGNGGRPAPRARIEKGHADPFQDQHAQDHGSLVGPEEFHDGNIPPEDDCNTPSCSGPGFSTLSAPLPQTKEELKEISL